VLRHSKNAGDATSLPRVHASDDKSFGKAAPLDAPPKKTRERDLSLAYGESGIRRQRLLILFPLLVSVSE
jgi:hypothetical protein